MNRPYTILLAITAVSTLAVAALVLMVLDHTGELRTDLEVGDYYILHSINANTDIRYQIAEIRDDVMTIELDMSEVPYISSAGLRVILNADEIMQDRNGIKLIGVNNDVRAILEMTGFYDTLDIE